MDRGKIVALEDRIPKLKEQRRKRANKLLSFLLSLFFLLIVLIVYIQSPLSNVKKITVKGNHTYTDEQLIAKSGLNHNINIWDINEENVKKNLTVLPEVKSVTVQSKWSGNVALTIEEHKTIAYFAKGTKFHPILENGEMLSYKHSVQLPVHAPLLVGFKKGDILEDMIDELELLHEEIVNSISEIHYMPKETDPYHVSLYMNDGFEVSATLRTFSEKMSHYPAIVSQLDPNIKGVIDLEVGSFFKAYKIEGDEQVEEEKTEG